MCEPGSLAGLHLRHPSEAGFCSSFWAISCDLSLVGLGWGCSNESEAHELTEILSEDEMKLLAGASSSSGPSTHTDQESETSYAFKINC